MSDPRPLRPLPPPWKQRVREVFGQLEVLFRGDIELVSVRRDGLSIELRFVGRSLGLFSNQQNPDRSKGSV